MPPPVRPARRKAAISGKCPFLGFDARTTLGGDLPPSVGRKLGKPRSFFGSSVIERLQSKGFSERGFTTLGFGR